MCRVIYTVRTILAHSIHPKCNHHPASLLPVNVWTACILNSAAAPVPSPSASPAAEGGGVGEMQPQPGKEEGETPGAEWAVTFLLIECFCVVGQCASADLHILMYCMYQLSI